MTNNAKGLALTSLGVFIMSLESLFIKFSTVSSFLFSFYVGIFMFISMASTLIFKKKVFIQKALTTSFPINPVAPIINMFNSSPFRTDYFPNSSSQTDPCDDR